MIADAPATIQALHELEAEQVRDQLDLIDLKRDRDAFKAGIILDCEDPKSLGANAEQREARIQQIYQYNHGGIALDDSIRDREVAIANRTVEIDYHKRRYGLSIAVIRAEAGMP